MARPAGADSNPIDILRFYAEAGVDLALEEAPVDRFALSRAQAEAVAQRQEAAKQRRAEPAAPAPQRPAPPPAARTEPPTLTVPSDAAIMAAREAAATAETLDALRATLESFEGCNLRFTATNLVFSDGNPEARVMFVGRSAGHGRGPAGAPLRWPLRPACSTA